MTICDFRTPAARAFRIDARNPRTTSFITSRANGTFCIVAGSPRMCMRISGTPRRCDTSASRGSKRRPETSLIICAPALMAASATWDLRVSTTIGIFSAPRKPSSTGRMRASSVSAAVPVEPGRVDSPPMSSRSAPARSISKACSIALCGSRNLPPSEKLSGVTFRTPITRVRSPSSSTPERKCSRYFRRLSIHPEFYLEQEKRSRVLFSVNSAHLCGLCVRFCSESIQVEVTDGFADGRILGFLHRFFKLFRQDVFLVGLLEPRIRELILALPLLLAQYSGRVSQVHVRPFARRLLVRKHHAQRRVDRQFRLAARARNPERLLALPHGAILILPAPKESSLFKRKRGADSHAYSAKLKTNNGEPSSLRRILPARKSRCWPQFRPHHFRIRARRRLRRGGRRSRLFRQRLAFHQQLHFVSVDHFALQQRLGNTLQRLFIVGQEVVGVVVAAVYDELLFLVDLDRRVFGIVAMLRDLAAQEDGFVLLPICQRTQFAHAPLANHVASNVRGAFDVVARARGDVPEEKLLRRAPTHQHSQHGLEIFPCVGVLVVFRQLHGQAQRHAARNNRDLVHRVGAGSHGRDQRGPGFA